MATVLALVALPGAVQAADVTVVTLGDARVTVPLPAADVVERKYTLRDASGQARTRTVTGTSLGAVLRAAQADVDSFAFAEAQDPAGGAVLFSREQALDGDPPAVFTESPEGLQLLRPSTGGSDPNAADVLTGPGLVVRLRAKARMSVSASASKARPRVGERVTFTAAVEGAGAGEPVELSWFFPDDDRSGSGAEVDHTFRKAGTYVVSVGATTAGDPAGASDAVTITVGKARKPDAAPADEPAEPAAGGGAGAGNGGAGATASGSGAASAPSTPATPRARREPAAAVSTPDEPQIAGELLDLTATPPQQVAAVAPAPAPPAKAENAGLLALPPAVWTGLALAAALGAGFWLETRGRPA